MCCKSASSSLLENVARMMKALDPVHNMSNVAWSPIVRNVDFMRLSTARNCQHLRSST